MPVAIIFIFMCVRRDVYTTPYHTIAMMMWLFPIAIQYFLRFKKSRAAEGCVASSIVSLMHTGGNLKTDTVSVL